MFVKPNYEVGYKFKDNIGKFNCHCLCFFLGIRDEKVRTKREGTLLIKNRIVSICLIFLLRK